MRYFLAWVGCGVLGVIVDRIRHRKDVRAAMKTGGYWTTSEITFLIIISVLLGPGLLAIPLMRHKVRV